MAVVGPWFTFDMLFFLTVSYSDFPQQLKGMQTKCIGGSEVIPPVFYQY